ncbi:MAG: type III-B CRISPR-associated protein Cas10/Cmr2 [Saprospiraceae bacterium]|nr:type III-B CRISPR-associated protein Cas10/Cmr2 [Saprospiraceae bacterium]
MTHLFLFTIGPVQSFIAQARKVHDLYSGSRILSELCKVAADHFEKKHGGEVIFPDISSDAIPNRFLGKITAADDLASIGKSVADAVQDYWRMQFDEPQKGVEFSLAELLDPTTYHEAKRQIEQHLDIQWLFQPLADETDATYRRAYDELNKNLNAVKNTRPFFTPNEKGRKCSLDGERNVIFYRLANGQVIRQQDKAPLYSVSNVTIGYNDLSQLKLRHLQPGEGLSAVSMLKRFQEFEAGDFPDTAEFALADTMHEVGSTSLSSMTKIFGHSHPKHLNWQLLFEENLNERYFEKQGLSAQKLQDAKDIQKALADKAKEHGRKLEKYYALVVFDGDHMGEWWKGTHLKHGVHLETFHKTLTGKLADFAKAVRAEYPKGDHRGWVIYAGGDDFLGFFNLHHLTGALDFLRDTYQQTVHEQLSAHIEGEHKLTFSAGVCIAHYKEPLSLVLAQAREMEKDAKNLRDKKDAIGIGVIPGSGQTAEVVLPFEDFPNLGKVIAALQTPDFSNAFVSKARAELTAFADDDGKLKEKLLPTAHSLLDRAVSRACNLTKNEGESDEEFQKRKKEKVEPLQTAVKNLLNAHNQKLSAFFDALDIADFIERQTHISPTKNEPAEHETTT